MGDSTEKRCQNGSSDSNDPANCGVAKVQIGTSAEQEKIQKHIQQLIRDRDELKNIGDGTYLGVRGYQVGAFGDIQAVPGSDPIPNSAPTRQLMIDAYDQRINELKNGAPLVPKVSPTMAVPTIPVIGFRKTSPVSQSLKLRNCLSHRHKLGNL